MVQKSYIQDWMIGDDKNIGSVTTEEIKTKLKSSDKPFLLIEDEDTSNEYSHFYFMGKYKGNEVIFDAVMYTLRLQHESELFEIAEHRAAQHFPHYKKITYEEDENGNLKTLDDLEEEIGLYMAEVILELEEEGQLKVKEHVDFDEQLDIGIGLDIGLNREKITLAVIEKFIKDYNAGTLQLDDTLYSFQTENQEV